VICHCAEAL
jgi:hypothetical protein